VCKNFSGILFSFIHIPPASLGEMETLGRQTHWHPVRWECLISLEKVYLLLGGGRGAESYAHLPAELVPLRAAVSSAALSSVFSRKEAVL